MNVQEKSCFASDVWNPLWKLLLIFVAIYFFELASFPLSLDEEFAAIRLDPSIWIKEGRWGAYLVEKFILYQPTIPFVAPAIFGFFCCLSYIIVLSIIAPKQELTFKEYLLFPVFCGYPTWFFIAEFYSNISATGAGLFFTACSMWILFSTFTNTQRFQRYILAGILAGLAISMYQSFVFMVAVLGYGLIIIKYKDEPFKQILQKIIVVTATVIAGIFVYKIGDYGFRQIIDGAKESHYISGFFRPEEFWEHPLGILKNIFIQITNVYGFKPNFYGRPFWAVPLLLIISFLTILCSRQFGALSRRCLLVTALGCIAIIPFALNLVTGGIIPIRTYVSVPFVVWTVFYLLITHIRSNNYRRICHILLFFVILQSIIINNAYQAAQYFVLKRDLLLSAAIQQRLSVVPGFDPKKIYPIVTYGGVRFKTTYPRPQSSGIGKSFYEHDGGNNRRIALFMRLHGYANITEPSNAQFDEATPELMNMPLWPAKGSLKIKNGIVLVRFDNKPGRFNLESFKRLNIDFKQ